MGRGRTTTLGRLVAAIPSAVLLTLAASVAGLAVNAVRPGGLSWSKDWSHHVETLAHEAGVPVVFLPEVRTVVDSGEGGGVYLLDARGAEEYAAGHIPGAFCVPPEELDVVLPGLALAAMPDAAVVTYCSGMDCDDALTLARALTNRAFTAVSMYSGGFAEWTEYGGEVETGAGPEAVATGAAAAGATGGRP